ncbi:MAG: 50S ribosomal protein L11 methyltransferase [Thermodesulfobacteriota bacterium]
MPGEWIEVVAKGPPASKGEAAALLIASGSPGVLETSKGRTQTLTAYFSGSSLRDIALLRKKAASIGWKLTTSPYTEEDWLVKWRRNLRPLRAGRVLVKPSWSGARRRRGEVVLEIDPGMAFGTGHHATTRLCLKALSAYLGPGGSGRVGGGNVLDVGTGSGILAIAAKKLGAKSAIGIDIDPEALKVARKNARLNNVKVSFSSKAVSEVRGRYRVVVANILAGVLIGLAPDIVRKVGPGGILILSGILKEEAGGVRDAYAELGLCHVKTMRSREWSAVILKREP